MLGTFEEEFSKIETEYCCRPKDDLFTVLSASSLRAIVFGAGFVGKHVARSLQHYLDKSSSSQFVAFCDNFKTGNCDEFRVPIISPDEMMRYYQDAVIIIAVGTHEASDTIYNQLLELGVHCEQVFRRYSGFELMSIDEFYKYYDGYKWAYDFFEDTTSKTIILNRIRGHLSDFEMKSSPFETIYFEQDVIQFTDHEVFVDGGCYIGDTALTFIRQMKGRYDHIYGFEPERENFETAKLNLMSYENIEMINKGLWSKKDQLSFHVDNIASTIASNGEISISVTSLDEFFADGEVKRLPTFIKMDIEGAEKHALLGMKNIIDKAHPKLAISAYHKPEDIYELPQLITQLGKGYRFALRHYTAGMYDTVLYAI